MSNPNSNLVVDDISWDISKLAAEPIKSDPRYSEVVNTAYADFWFWGEPKRKDKVADNVTHPSKLRQIVLSIIVICRYWKSWTNIQRLQ